jgi:phosphohistidine phosphatase
MAYEIRAFVRPRVARVIWFLRHGDAEGTTPDFDRKLTKKGRRQAEHAGAALKALGVSIELCLTSPKVRALETAEIACKALSVEPTIDKRLSGGPFDPLDLAAGLDGVLLVGHEPDFSNAIGELTGGRVDIKKGGLAGIEQLELSVLLRPKETGRIATVEGS